MRDARGWGGSVDIGSGWALLVGSAGDNATHAHHAFQLCVPIDGPLGLAQRSLSSGAAALVSAGLPHALRPVRRAAILYVLPESRLGRRLIARYPGRDLYELEPSLARTLRDALLAVAERDDQTCAETVITQALRLPSDPPPPLDARLVRALAVLDASLERNPKFAELATAVALSENRLAYLFRTELGIAFRPYRRWRRLERAFRSLLVGEDLTRAAHSAGFADSAHLSRSVVRAFGVPPSIVRSLLQPTDERIVQVPLRPGR